MVMKIGAGSAVPILVFYKSEILFCVFGSDQIMLAGARA